MPRSSQYPWNALLVNWDPLSVMILFGTPNMQMMDLINLDCGLLIDLDHRGCFRPLGEFVDGDIEIPVPSDGPGEWSMDVQPLNSE
jgi:hypothetical protein